MDEIKAPNEFYGGWRPWLFLSGSIEMGSAERWQDRIVRAFATGPGTILNPRRDNWDSSWIQQADNPFFAQQVEWELQGLEQADVRAIYFAPDTKSPITLLELGFMHDKKHVIVCCPDGFWRRGNVEIFCTRKNHDGMVFTDDWNEFIALTTAQLLEVRP